MDDREVKRSHLKMDDRELKFTKEDREKVFGQINSQGRKQNKHPFFRKPIGFAVTTCLLLIMFIGFLATTILSDNENQQLATQENTESFSVLLMGKDAGKRTDANVLLTYNKSEGSIKMVSIPRDTYVSILDSDGKKLRKDKLAHAYAYGSGPGAVVSTVSQLLNIPIDYYVTVDVEGFVAIIDSLGGIDYDVQGNWKLTGAGDEVFELKEGKNHLDGQEALALIRERKTRPDGSIGREKEQLRVLRTVIEKIKNNATISQIKDLSDLIDQTNLTWDQLETLARRADIESFEVLNLSKGIKGIKIDGIYYMKLDKDVLNQISEELRNHLNLK